MNCRDAALWQLPGSNQQPNHSFWAAVGLYVRKGVGLPDLADKNDWLFANVAFEGDLPQNIVQEINKNGHAFRDMD